MASMTARAAQPIFVLPTRDEVAAMLRSRGVFITAILAAMVAFLGLLFALVYLISTGKPVADITDLVQFMITLMLYGKVRSIERNTNGTQARLMNHALGPDPSSRDERQ